MSNKLLYKKKRSRVAKAALSLLNSGLVVNTSGNVSERIADHIIITPSGRAYDSLHPKHICVLDLDGNRVEGELLPSSETPLHLALYKSDPAIKAIVHTHSVHATAVSTLVDVLPAIHYQMVDLGGEVPVAPYATFGSNELADSVLGVITGHTAALMKNHGSISFADNLAKALARTITLEWCCEVWLKAMTVGKPSTLTRTQLDLAEQQMSEIAEARKNPKQAKDADCHACNKSIQP